MQTFLKYILKVIFVLIVSAYTLDFCFTKAYLKSNPITKFQNIRALKNKSIDYVFLGSSRVENVIMPNIIEKKTKKKALNLGFQSSKLSDIYLIFQLLDEYNIKYKKVFIQIDHSFNYELSYSIPLNKQILPYLNENKLISENCKLNDYNSYLIFKYVPFFKYLIKSNSFSFRNVCSILIKKQKAFILNDGYLTIDNYKKQKDYDLPLSVKSKNKFYDSIVNYSIRNKKNIVFYTAPFRMTKTNLNFMKELNLRITNLIDFSKTIKEDKYFHDNVHLNDTGSVIFNNILIEKLKL